MEYQENQNTDVFVVNGVANYSFVKNNVNNVKTLSSLLGLIYKTGWYYKQWKEIKKCNENYRNISPFWRGIFYIGYAGRLKDMVKGLYEAKMNMVLQNDAVPQEEKETWQKEYKKFNSIFANFALTQQAINRILPVGHPENKTTWGSFLGLLPFAIILMIIFGINIISFLLSGCYRTEGNVYTNTCGNYSFTFPLKSEIGLWQDSGFDNICQQNEKETICLADIIFNSEEDFSLQTLTQDEGDKILNKFTKKYAGNTTHCFKLKDEDNHFVNTCYMKVERQEPLYFGFFSKNEEDYMENLEKLMNSYKNI